MMNLAKMLLTDVSRSNFLADFRGINVIKPKQTFEIALHGENLNKNRYQTVLPYDFTRVVLQTDSDNDYVNASWINVELGDKKVNRYVATQGPLKDTVKDFWWLVWQEKITTIVMLTELTDSQGGEKCYQYWRDNGEKIELTCHSGQPITITRVDIEDANLLTIREFLMISKSTGKQLVVKHYHFKGWPDMGVPEKHNFINFYDLLKKYAGFKSKSDIISPTLVHCSAGIGRTGTYILIETMIEMIKDKLNVDPIAIVELLREQRLGMVETEEQILFACETVLNYYKR